MTTNVLDLKVYPTGFPADHGLWAAINNATDRLDLFDRFHALGTPLPASVGHNLDMPEGDPKQTIYTRDNLIVISMPNGWLMFGKDATCESVTMHYYYYGNLAQALEWQAAEIVGGGFVAELGEAQLAGLMICWTRQQEGPMGRMLLGYPVIAPDTPLANLIADFNRAALAAVKMQEAVAAHARGVQVAPT